MTIPGIIGGAIAFYIVYALLALFLKHKKGLIVSGILWLFAGIALLATKHDGFVLVSSAIGFIAVSLIGPIRIKSPGKKHDELQRKKVPRKTNKNQGDRRSAVALVRVQTKSAL